MKRLYALVIAAALCFPSLGALAWWQSIQQVGVSAGGGLPIFTYLGASNQNSVTSPITFTSFNIGTAASNRVIAIIIVKQGNASSTVTGVSVGGNAASQVTGAAAGSANTSIDIWSIALTSGTSANIVVTLSDANSTGMTIGVAAVGTNTPTPGTASSVQIGFAGTAATTVTIPGSGVAFTGLILQNASTSTFSNMTIDDSRVGTGPFGSTVYFGHQTVTGTDTATFSGSDTASMSTAPWGP